MRNRTPTEIQKVPFPEVFLDALQGVNSLLVDSIHRDGLPIENGLFDLGVVDKPIATALFFVRWITNTNGIIDHLNLVISDMRSLPFMFSILGGSPRKRFYLLVATYFHEFYRFRETHSQVVKAAAERGYIEKNQVKAARQSFHDAFESMIDSRNSLVHGTPIWIGKRHFDLNYLGMAWDLGYEVRDKETGETREIKDALTEICTHTADVFRDEGNRMAAVQKRLVECYVSLAQNPD